MSEGQELAIVIGIIGAFGCYYQFKIYRLFKSWEVPREGYVFRHRRTIKHLSLYVREDKAKSG